ncbi:hypothetical protein EON65_25095 [archaeon]|nr:MAG: hypothetical protein EON65_25095 [archaeon]
MSLAHTASSSAPYNKLNVWIKHELAAIKIQRVVRQWLFHYRCKRSFKVKGLASIGYGRHRFFHKTSDDLSPHPPSASDCIQALIAQKADWTHQTAFWRIIIDIKRSFPTTTTDLIVKALLEANGEVSRAMILLGTKEFCLQHKKPISENIKSLLLPHLEPAEASFHNPLLDLISSKSKVQTSGSSSGNADLLAHWAENRRRNVDMVRSLRVQHRKKMRQEFVNKISYIIEKAYFPSQERPSSATKGGRPQSAGGHSR